jgi:hypothetical protein
MATLVGLNGCRAVEEPNGTGRPVEWAVAMRKLLLVPVGDGQR